MLCYRFFKVMRYSIKWILKYMHIHFYLFYLFLFYFLHVDNLQPLIINHCWFDSHSVWTPRRAASWHTTPLAAACKNLKLDLKLLESNWDLTLNLKLITWHLPCDSTRSFQWGLEVWLEGNNLKLTLKDLNAYLVITTH